MPRVGFEPTISAFERAKTIHALDRAATGIGDNSKFRFGILVEGSRHDSVLDLPGGAEEDHTTLHQVSLCSAENCN
jgi:hypothetical protein